MCDVPEFDTSHQSIRRNMASYSSQATLVRQFMSTTMIPGMQIDEQSQSGKRDIRVSFGPFEFVSFDHCQLYQTGICVAIATFN